MNLLQNSPRSGRPASRALLALLAGYVIACGSTVPSAMPQPAGAPASGEVGGPAAEAGSPTGLASFLAAGSEHTCAIVADGVRCWGDNTHGQLGDGTVSSGGAPKTVAGLANATALAAEGSMSCALLDGGAVRCWGDNMYGQLGDGTTDEHHTPVAVTHLASGVIAVAVGGNHACALTEGGGVKCWGANTQGELGDGTTTDRLVPTDAIGLSSGAIAIAVGLQHTCVVIDGGAIKCWGSNPSGAVGDGTTTDRHEPTDVQDGNGASAAVAAAEGHSCVVLASGSVRCWGGNEQAQLGGTREFSLVPVDVTGLTGAVGITTGKADCFGLTLAASCGEPLETVMDQ